MVPAGSIVHCQLSVITDGFNSADATVSEVSSLLSQSGYGVTNAQTSVGVLNTIEAAGYGTGFQVSMDVYVPSAFGQAQDVALIVANAFYQVTGSYPAAVTAPYVSSPGGAPAVTGLPALDPNGIGSTANDTSVTGAISNALSGVEGLGSNLLIGAVILIVAILLIVGYAPNSGKVAGAFA